MAKLEGKRAIVTGGGRGIGRAVALALAAEGAALVITSRSEPELQAVAAEARQVGLDVTVIPADVSKKDDVETVIRAAGAVDILVNNAGVHGPIGAFSHADLEQWWAAMQINLGGTVRFCQGVIPGMVARGGGRIINLSGGGATSPRPNLAAYSVSKTAIVRLTENLAEELKPFNILVNAVAPGTVNTHLHDDVLAAGARAGEHLFQQTRLMRETGAGAVPAAVVAGLAVFLASGASEGLTGKLISALHDPWREWNGRGAEITASPLYTLRRLDPFTLRPLKHLV